MASKYVTFAEIIKSIDDARWNSSPELLKLQLSLNRGEIAAYSSSGIEALIVKKTYKNIDDFLSGCNFSDMLNGWFQSYCRGPISTKHVNTPIGYVTVDRFSDYIDIYMQSESRHTYEKEVTPHHWRFAHYDAGQQAILADDLLHKSRHVFYNVSLERADYQRVFQNTQAHKRGKTGPKGFYNEEVFSYALGLLVI